MADQKISQLTTATTPLAGTEVLPIVQSSTTKKVSVANLTVGRATEASTLLLNGTDNQFVLAAGANKGLEIGTDGTTAVLLSYNRGTAAYKRLGHNALDFIWSLSGTEALSLSTAANFRIATGNLVIGTSGKGIDFSATAGAGTSELLNDYEEGTWSPTIIGTTTAGTATYDVRNTSYTKIGRLVHVEAYMVYSAGTGVGDLRIGNLPYAVENTYSTYTPIVCRQSSIAVPLTQQIYGRAEPGTSYITMYSITDDGTQTGLAYDGDALIAFQANYTAA
tara:strand:- start:1093 stop:1926 length:834 start_codon:yes stop_codon:yes gene_type:complete